MRRWLIDLMCYLFHYTNFMFNGGVFVLVKQSQKAEAMARVSISDLGPIFFTIEIHSRW
ncbi:hypothetical protein HanRHA438_Chr04g0168111 [Helianthus annuus]|uniref:Uncharacterized protein n=1 Tax=Helianthus annuus TaxID=4232 RepID=A0A9K3J6W2_HELAN|nr:hypothetical protein HanXRQr2_Chr04g0157901 [Helianthus annuus]KAJ0580494.1 hypothetical protein HanHA300_Chr04g0129871 [Helianthus annuus]KAJ0588078.1 hypothetical protein HanIR_Chr04g0170451 [Helianthus annuus]KAJ0596452.1 hypothetical protein HanHA89_Chr04g0142921 [Helianthus annuus]KAJ0757111.1 hypothetical protein HanLR1_Chr04g0134831 [Helianthus annuus]